MDNEALHFSHHAPTSGDNDEMVVKAIHVGYVSMKKMQDNFI